VPTPSTTSATRTGPPFAASTCIARYAPTASDSDDWAAKKDGVVGCTKTASPLDRFLRLFSDVRAGEGFSTLLLSINCGLIFAAYYIIKPLRDGLVLAEYSAEIKSYLQVANVLALAVSCRSMAASPTAFPGVA
jgi:hypothetical protein